MAPAISIYSRGRFSINYYCCSCNPGELKTNKRMTTETDSLGSFKNSVFFPKVGSKIFQAYEGLGGGSGRQLTRALPYAPWCPPLPEGRRLSSVRVINGWEAKAGVRARVGRRAGAGPGPRPRRAGAVVSLARPPAAASAGGGAGSAERAATQPRKQRAAAAEGRARPPGSARGGAARCRRRTPAAPRGPFPPGQQPRSSPG